MQYVELVWRKPDTMPNRTVIIIFIERSCRSLEDAVLAGHKRNIMSDKFGKNHNYPSDSQGKDKGIDKNVEYSTSRPKDNWTKETKDKVDGTLKK